MCYPSGKITGKLIIQEIVVEETVERSERVITLKGIYDRTPKNWEDRFSLFFQRLELFEKIAEIVDESFHLFNPLFQHYKTSIFYQTLYHLHFSAHHIEYVLHSFCFLGDLTHLLTGKFLQYQDQECTQLDILRTSARICHAVAHFFATVKFLGDINVYSLDRLSKILKYTSVFSSLGYAFWTISLIWKRHHEEHWFCNIGMHLGGCLAEILSLKRNLNLLTRNVLSLNKVHSIARIIHAWSGAQNLMPKDREEVLEKAVLFIPE